MFGAGVFIGHCLQHGGQRDGGRPFSPFIFGFFIQNKNCAIGRRVLKIGLCRKFNTAADEGLGGFGADIRAAEQANVDIDDAGIPKFRIHPHQRSVFFPNAGMDDEPRTFALLEMGQFFKRSGKSIRAFTVRDILDEEIRSKLA